MKVTKQRQTKEYKLHKDEIRQILPLCIPEKGRRGGRRGERTRKAMYTKIIIQYGKQPMQIIMTTESKLYLK